MKRALLLIVLTIFGLALNTIVAYSQTPNTLSPATQSPASIEMSQIIFPWVFKAGGIVQNWQEGIAHFILGIAGALVTVYLFLGEFLPSMGGKVEYELLKEELKDFKRRRERALTEREKYARGESEPPKERMNFENELADDYDLIIERLERQISQERWRLFGLGFPIYIFLGGFFATAFATNLLQAILIGFGWTAVADRIGLQKEIAVRKEFKDAEISELEKESTEQAGKAEKERRALEAKIDLQNRYMKELISAIPPASK